MIINKNRAKAAVCAVAGAFLIGSCTSGFEGINDPKEAISEEILSRDSYDLNSFIAQLLNNAFPEQENAYQMNYDLIGNYLGRYLTFTPDGWNGKTFANFNAPLSWVRYPYRDLTPKIISNMNNIQRLASRDGIDYRTNLSYNWALILRAHAFLHLTDKYGPLPLGLDESRPSVYNGQDVIYKQLIKDLDDAVAYIRSNNLTVVEGATRTDKIYAGDFSKWRLFANSLKLRIALRIRYVEPALAQATAEAAVADGVIQQNGDNLYRTYNPLGLYKTSVDWGDSRACADLETHLTGYADPRLPKFFKKVNRKVTETQREYIGALAGVNIKSKADAVDVYSAVNIEPTGKNPWLTAAEMYFCRAEGALLGWNMGGGSAQEYYEEGIKASFEQWGASGAAEYLANTDRVQANYSDPTGASASSSGTAPNRITIAWRDVDGEDRKLQRIITQKWIALFPNGQEAWSEIRRTGYPLVFNVSVRNGYSIHVPKRIPFDSEERVNNPDNYTAAVTLLGGEDNYGTKMWWDAKN